MKLTPKFNKKMPSNSKSYFKSDSDDNFIKKYPMEYKILVSLGISVLVLPAILYIFLVYLVLGVSEYNWWPVFGFIGSFIFGIGCFNIVAAFLNQYLGHKFTIICMSSGILLVIFSLVTVLI